MPWPSTLIRTLLHRMVIGGEQFGEMVVATSVSE
jgi:hypothetical protein